MEADRRYGPVPARPWEGAGILNIPSQYTGRGRAVNAPRCGRSWGALRMSAAIQSRFMRGVLFSHPTAQRWPRDSQQTF